ncbi:MAG: hypothetical protein QOK35_2134 [Pseudonocardiales bacterium]|nr:hypothetical protein [Pseudonocardiales bacterium]
MSDAPAPAGRRTVSGAAAEPPDGSAAGHPADAESGRGPGRRGESPLERADRNMVEMLQELRVAQTGVQILFAFLLSLSFTDRFARIDEVQRWTYVVTLLMTTLTTALLVAPAAVHRILFARHVKGAVVRIGQRLFVAGLVTLAFTLMGAVLLVLDVAIGRGRAVPITIGVGVMLIGLWFVLPLPVLRRGERDGPGEPDG